MELSKKSSVSLFLSFCLVFSLISVLLVKPVDAKTVRVAVVASLSGDVTIKKGGGSKSYDAYESMSLNQGDTVYTGEGSSVTLNLSNGDSEITLGANSEVNVSDLSSSDGSKKSKLKVWAGSMWVKVKSLAGSNDEFEVETPTAVMGVRGTQFFVGVDPVTGKIKMAVGAGNVSASTVTTNADSTQSFSITYLYPTQQISMDSRDETKDLSLKVEFIDIDKFIEEASPEVIQELIKSKAEIDKENDAFIAKKSKEIADGKFVDDQTSLVIKDQAELDKVKQNLDNLIGNIAKKAVADKKIDKDDMNKIIDEANKKISDENRKLDLNKVKELDKTAGVDAEKEKQKLIELQKLESEKLKKKQEEAKKLDEIKKKLAAALKAMEDEKARLAAANKAAQEKQTADAEVILKNGNKAPETTTGGPGTGSGSDPGSGSEPTVIPAVSLGATLDPNSSNFNLDIYLSDFVNANDIYGVEVHLLYGFGGANYGNAPTINGEIFNSATSADNVSEHIDANNVELIYTVTNFGSQPNNISVVGKKKLASIPMYGAGTHTIKVGKIVAVRKNGSSVQTVAVPYTINPFVTFTANNPRP
ncbi:FecR domain-containing protein [Paenibacillus sp. HWE-109]|uniref:FecR family protein n=1 Tax=Paenibacillus sp. HWE-109 TaxID=1306526 RepID=UPI001EDF05D3|nr:FecR domain-containing protein [Paenibacillus sp. HWE-109]UKS24013.1 FecR domain-containing protein [Paenibacillus sp. HWE-109]